MSLAVVIEISDRDNWQPFRGCLLMPQHRQPTVLHPSREVAEEEAKRLARIHPHGVFAIFELAAAGVSVKVPTHITLGGQVVATASMPKVVDIVINDGDDIPF